jgi:diguanylate cyclase (GGDEF)-like protein
MSAAGSSVQILVVDDDRLLRDIAAATLEAAGFLVRVAAGGHAAVAECGRAMPDLLIMDVDMPEGDGYQACAEIRTLPGGRDVPIVMATGHDDAASIHLAYEAGATDFVIKPINWPLLVHRVRYVLRGARTIEALRWSEQKNSALLRAIPDGILLVDRDGTIRQWLSPILGLAAPSRQGAAPEQAAPQHVREVFPAASLDEALRCLETTLDGSASAFEFALGEPDQRRHLECRYLPHATGQVLAIVRDITQRKLTEAHIHRLAYFDSLTGLPNREWIGDYLGRSLREAASLRGEVALLFVDLDQFKRINDTLGHGTGDALLKQVGERLTTALSESGLPGQLARVGGDEFIAVLTGATRAVDAERVAERIRATLAVPFRQNGYELVVTPSIGIALFPEHGADAQTLLKNADGAMYEAKASGRNQFRLYSSVVHARAVKRLSLEMELRRAFETDALDVYYQPQYDARELKLAGAEALLRWFHPERGQIPTQDLVTVAEETGLIAEIGRWTLERVCQDLKRWRSRNLAAPAIAINVSGRDFARPDVPLRLSAVVEAARLPASLFELELTEGVLMQDVEGGQRSLQALKEFGFALAIDDFGTGYCSLNYLKRFPLDTLKIDRTFINDITRCEEDAAIVRAIIGLGHNLDLKLVAEGVETGEQLEFLRRERCDLIQGFFMSQALPAQAFERLLSPVGSAVADAPGNSGATEVRPVGLGGAQ